MTAPTYATLTNTMFIGGTGLPAKGIGNERSILEADFNIATFVAGGGLTTQSVKLVNVPANTLVVMHAVWNQTALSLGSGPAISIGDSASTTQWVNANSTLTTNTYATIANSTKTYAAADTINVTVTGGTVASGTVSVFYELIDLSADTIAVVP